MAHRLSIINGVAETFHTGEAPWHKLGVGVAEAPTSAEALRLAHLDWRVELRPVAVPTQRVGGEWDWANPTLAPRRHGVVRVDTGTVLGVVRDRYRPLQNVDAFAVCDGVLGDAGVTYETAGALDQGERVWLLARLPGDLEVGPGDVVRRYLLLHNSHNGYGAFRLLLTPVRVVCHNTLTLALRNTEGVVLSHQGTLTSRVSHFQEVLGLTDQAWAQVGRQFRALLECKPATEVTRAYLTELFPGVGARSVEVRKLLTLLLEDEKQTVGGAEGSLWAAYNSVTQWVDHGRATRGKKPGEQATARLRSAWFGGGAHLKRRALTRALELAGVTPEKQLL